MTTTLEPQRRGTTFRYRFSFGGDWVWSQFSEIYFTLRSSVPPSTETTDTAAVAQASKTGGSVGSITVDPDDDGFGWVEFDASVTKTWPLGTLLWDLEGTRDSDGSVDALDDGDIEITPDMTRRN